MTGTLISTPPKVSANTTTEQSVTIHAIQTGWVRVRPQQIRGEGQGASRLLRTFLGRGWSQWLPINTWLIDHPEGLILVDTGETARAADPGYFPRWHPYFRRGLEEHVRPEDEIGPQLHRRGYDPRAVKTVVMTHLHTDHAGGLHHFPDSEILVEPGDYARACGFQGHLRGFLPQRYPQWLDPKPIEFLPHPYGPFDCSLPITQDEAVIIVPTPGHTAGHVSVVVCIDDVTYFLAGDTSYSEDLMIAGHVDGVAPNDEVAASTLASIRELAYCTSLVYLPSHDPLAAQRLADRQTVAV